ncbi:ParA family protein [Candidatus Synechococcus calcipolaris G9]|uniref:ParA family protein n=1 Tax=Candidatus Synechococcus calcipolaris G9 TaxID=1497997 RepID=A0ABT6F2B5_9SYNE|nr:ParA family protein [Candidatus Synechococcus calcipolaris]MDG2992005.1 ParA family protein [Candidatus Synechococcus calcipolaris G9]
MKTIFFVFMPKGGVGKTTISILLTAEMLRRNKAVQILDIDRQQELKMWVDEWCTLNPDKANLIVDSKNERDCLIIDSKPGADDQFGASNDDILKTLAAWSQEQTVRVILPFLPGKQEIKALRVAIELLDQYAPTIPRGIIINRRKNSRIDTELIAEAKQISNATVLGYLTDLIAYREIKCEGKAVWQYETTAAISRFDDFVRVFNFRSKGDATREWAKVAKSLDQFMSVPG